MVTGGQIVEAARELLGVWYEWWENGEPIPLWWNEYGDSPPPRWWFDANGTMCSDLVNYARVVNGLPSIGGTPAYYDWLQASGGVSFDPNSPGVPGALCVNPGIWRGGFGQGHVAIYTDEHTLIQATDGVGSMAGVNEGEQDYYSHGWAGYWMYGLMPDVQYEGLDALPQKPALPRWLGIGADGIVRRGGDFSQGWLEITDADWLKYRDEFQGE